MLFIVFRPVYRKKTQWTKHESPNWSRRGTFYCRQVFIRWMIGSYRNWTMKYSSSFTWKLDAEIQPAHSRAHYWFWGGANWNNNRETWDENASLTLIELNRPMILFCIRFYWKSIWIFKKSRGSWFLGLEKTIWQNNIRAKYVQIANNSIEANITVPQWSWLCDSCVLKSVFMFKLLSRYFKCV